MKSRQASEVSLNFYVKIAVKMSSEMGKLSDLSNPNFIQIHQLGLVFDDFKPKK